MAIEAMRQMADERRKIKGYLIKDATFVKPLNIRTDEEGVETELYMRPLKDSFNLGSSTCEFRLYVYEDNVWAENSRGILQAEYEEEQSEVDRGREERERSQRYNELYAHALETCTRNVDSKVMYEFLERQIGLNYGPSFQALHNMTCNEKGEAMAEVKTFREVDADRNYTQSHVIHPTTLDAMAQLILVALTRGAERTTFTTIPTRIRNSWISNSGLSYPSTESIHAYTKSSFKGRRSTESSIFAINKATGDVLVTINVETTTVATGTKSSMDQIPKRQIFYNTVSKPDVELMDKEMLAWYCQAIDSSKILQAELRKDSTPPSACNKKPETGALMAPEMVTSCISSLAKFLDALAHKNPRLKVLEIGGEALESTARILEVLGIGSEKQTSNPRCAQYDFTATSLELLEPVRELYHYYEPLVNFKVLDIFKDSELQDFKAGSYDIIIANECLNKRLDLDMAIRKIRSLLKPSGTLALYDTTGDTGIASIPNELSSSSPSSTANGQVDVPDLSVESWHGLLCRNNFSGTDLSFIGEQGGLSYDRRMIISTAAAETANDLELPRTLIVTLAGSKLQQSIASELQATLTSKGALICEVISLEQLILTQDLAQSFCIFLVELDEPILSKLKEEEFSAFQKPFTSAQGVIWTTGNSSNPELSMIHGLARVVRTENLGLKFVTISLEKPGKDCTRKIAQVFEKTITNSIDDYEPEYTEEQGILHIKRLIESDINNEVHRKIGSHQSKVQEFGASPPLSLVVESFGLLDSMRFHEDKGYSEPLAPYEAEIEVKAMGLDDLTTSGRADQDNLGGECTGIITRTGSLDSPLKAGDRVCAASFGSFKSYARVNSQLVAKIPDDLSFTDAAALPITFTTAYYALIQKAQLEKGESILIHSASGAISQSAIQIAQHVGADVFVTVGSEEEEKLIAHTYNITKDHIFYSKDTSFSKGIMRMTQGCGVNVILNSLTGEGLIASLECIAPLGHFLDLGKRDSQANAKLPMDSFTKNVSYHTVDIADLSRLKPSLFQKSLQKVVNLVVEKKLQSPQPLHIFPVSKVLEAFQFTQNAKSTGKTVVEISKADLVPVREPLTVNDTK